jgi:hypothetical protein
MSIWDSIAAPLIAIVNKVIPDKAAAAAATASLQQMIMDGKLTEELKQLDAVTTNQSDINKVEAANTSLFVAGGRPAIMWICAAALAYQYLLKPLAISIALISGHPIPAPGLPTLDDSLWQLMFGMLGMGTLRSYDKLKGTDTKSIGK